MRRFVRGMTGFTALALAAALSVAGVARAERPAAVQLAQAGPAGPPAMDVASQLSDLHNRLQITPAQQPQFDAFARVMQQNTQEMDALLQKEPPNQLRNAVEDMRATAQAAATEAAELQRLLPPFEALYGVLSADQKKTADQLFAGPAQQGK